MLGIDREQDKLSGLPLPGLGGGMRWDAVTDGTDGTGVIRQSL